MVRWRDEWSKLEKDYPINIKDVVKYCSEFEILLKVNLNNMEKAKENLIKARGKLYLAVNSLNSEFYDRSILKSKEDLIILNWLKDDLNRAFSSIESREKDTIVEEDTPGRSKVGLSNITAYYTDLITFQEGVILNSLKKAKQEYLKLEESDRDPRVFLYILFKIVSGSVGLFGGLAKGNLLTKRGVISSFPTSYGQLMNPKGRELISKAYQEETGIDPNQMEESFDFMDIGDEEEEENEDEDNEDNEEDIQ